MVAEDLTPIRGIDAGTKTDRLVAGRVRRVFDLYWLQVTDEGCINIDLQDADEAETLDRFMELNGYELWSDWELDGDRSYRKK